MMIFEDPYHNVHSFSWVPDPKEIEKDIAEFSSLRKECGKWYLEDKEIPAIYAKLLLNCEY